MTDFVSPPIARNIGGCQPFKYCPVQHVYLIPDAVAGEISEEVSFNGSHRWYTGWHRETTASYEEKQRDTPQGILYDVVYKFFYPGNTAAISILFDELARMEHVLLVTDNNLQQRVVGEKSKGLKFRHSFNTGAGPDQLRGYQCEFYGTYKKRAPVYVFVEEVTAENDYMEDYVDDYFV